MPRQRGSKSKPSQQGPSVKDQLPEPSNDGTAVGLLDTLTAVQERAVSGQSGSTVEQLPIGRIAPHPYNPDHRHEDREELEGLARDIGKYGVLQPAVVASRAAVVHRSPDLQTALSEAVEWVILAGHRRWGASYLGGQTTLPAIVRDDLTDPIEITKVFLRENLNRLAITPLEEAEGYRRLAAQGQSQRAIAGDMGVSQSHVSKTLDLLKLPEVVQQALRKEELAPAEARRLLDLPEEHREDTYNVADAESLTIEAATRRALGRIERDRADASARQRIQDEGLPEINPWEKWGSAYWQHLVRDNDVSEERKAGRLVGAVVEAGTAKYFSELPAPHLRRTMQPDNGEVTAQAVRPEPDDPHLLEQRQAHRNAFSERYDGCRRLVGDYSQLKSSTVIDILTDGVLVGEVEGGAFRFSAPVKHWLGIEYDSDEEVEAVTNNDRILAQRLAVAVSLAALEDEAGQPHYAAGTPWPTAITRHIRRLITLGYHEASQYEQTKLGMADAEPDLKADTH